MLNLDNYLLFKNSKDTLHMLSYDSAHGEYMTDSNQLAVNFDHVKREYCNQHNMSEERASSADALLQVANTIVFIEFKNGNARDQKREIKEKGDESIMIYCDITGQEISDTRENAEFILVYNEERTRIAKNEEKAIAMARLSHLSYAIFGLDRHEGLCFHNILTMNREEFSRWIKALFG